MIRWEKDPLGRYRTTVEGVSCMVRPDLASPTWVAIVYFPIERRKRRWQSKELAQGWCEVTAKAGPSSPQILTP